MASVLEVVRRIKIVAPQFDSLNDETLTTLANDAILVAQEDGFKGPMLVIAASYLAAHYASVVNSKNSNVVKQKLAVMEVTYKNDSFKSDYLNQYNNLLNTLTDHGKNKVTFI
ncbi:hypothetical protein IV73_GL000169 [Weissella kandleri]|uniref:DUF4054 domain-containing protein n=1 Tax=Weissella kandleri TaxID=1616 RepID=A0A0R2JEB5_9LACO|nr:DUF4054 domain-containing protein [Weissella kandleri]KRN75675.1 hypothetical protein IV73_GL000169 [Weissella kandleri]